MGGLDDAAVAVPVSIAAQRARRARRESSATSSRLSDRLLHRIAAAASSTAPLRDLLTELADVTIEATGADRCRIFLLDGTVIQPFVAVGAGAAEDLWGPFRELAPLDVRRIRGAARFLAAGRAVGISDAGAVATVPADWVRAFGSQSVALAPLPGDGRPGGLLTVEYGEPHDLGDDEAMLIETVAAHAGLAVRTAGLSDATRRREVLQQALASSVATLALPLEPAAVARHVVDAVTAILDPDSCVIAVFDAAEARLTVLARGTAGGDRIPTLAVPPPVRERLTAEWERTLRPVWFGADTWFAELAGMPRSAHHHLVVPLGAGGVARGVLVAGCDTGRLPDADQYAAAEALATVAAAALERARTVREAERAIRRIEVLGRVAAAVADCATPGPLVARLAAALGGDGIEVTAVVPRDRTVVRRLGWDQPAPVPTAGELAVPMRVGRRTVGRLHVAGALEPADRTFAEAVARTVGEALLRTAASLEAQAAADELAAADDRERLGAELHDNVGDLLVGIGLLAHRAADDLPPDSPWARRILRLGRIARDGKWALDQAGRALAFLPGPGRTLAAALRALAHSVEADSGIAVGVNVRGAHTAGRATDRALYRVAHEALVAAWRHGGCSLVSLTLECDPRGATTLRVRDDGLPLERRTDDRHDDLGVAAMRRAVAAVGGTVHVADATPRGVLVQARVGRSA